MYTGTRNVHAVVNTGTGSYTQYTVQGSTAHITQQYCSSYIRKEKYCPATPPVYVCHAQGTPPVF